MVEVQLVAVRVELPTNTPVILLQERGGSGRTLPIFVGTPEATAIAYALQGIIPPRPMTHDLLRDTLITLSVDVSSVVITELHGSTYYAEIHLLTAEGHEHIISSRPSDAIALAARLGTPIYADDGLIDAEGVLLAPDDHDDEVVENAEELVLQFREFINEVRPEDFSPGQ